MSLCDNFDIGVLPGVPITNREVEGHPEYLIVVTNRLLGFHRGRLRIIATIQASVIFTSLGGTGRCGGLSNNELFAMHHGHEHAFVLWLICVSEEWSDLADSICLLVPLIPTLGELKKVNLDGALHLVIVKVLVHHNPRVPFPLQSIITTTYICILRVQNGPHFDLCETLEWLHQCPLWKEPLLLPRLYGQLLIPRLTLKDRQLICASVDVPQADCIVCGFVLTSMHAVELVVANLHNGLAGLFQI